MKTISLLQPWGTLIVIGAKTLETRSWQTAYRGPLAIHAGKAFTFETRQLTWYEPFFTPLWKAGYWTQGDPRPNYKSLPVGCILGTVELVDIVRTEDIRDSLSATELAFGDYTDGRYAWQLANPVLFPEPIPARGALSLWEWQANNGEETQ